MEGSLSQLAHLKPGGHALRREVVVRHQRERILAAVIDVVAERGYRKTSVAAIIERAGVAKPKFYENFSSKEDAFLHAFDAGVAETGERLAAACEAAAPDIAARVDAGLAALLDFLAERPALARAVLLEAPLLGPALGERRAQVLAAFAPLLDGSREAAQESEGLPDNLEGTVLDGLYWLIYEAVLAGEPEPLTALRPALVEFALLPFLGPSAAADAAASC